MRVDVDDVVGVFLLRGSDQLAHDLVGVRPAGVLRADGHLPLGTLQAVAHAAHVDGDGLGHARRDGRRTAMADLLIDRDMDVDAAGRRQIFVAQEFGEAQQDADGQLVVQEAALDVALLRHAGARLEADEIARRDAELFDVVGAVDALVEHELNRVPLALGGRIIGVDVQRGVAKLHRAFVDAVELRHDAAVFPLGVVSVHAADIDDAQAAVVLDLRDHAAEGVRVRLQQQGVVFVRAAEVDQDAALDRPLCGEAQRLKFTQDEVRGVTRVARRAVDRQQFDRFLYRKIYIFFHIYHPSDVFSSL